MTYSIINACSFIDPRLMKIFSCDVEGIDDFIQNHAINYEVAKISGTDLIYNSITSKIEGFYSYGFATVDIETDPGMRQYLEEVDGQTNIFQNSQGITTFPVISLNFLGVQTNLQNKGLGKKMIIIFFHKIIDLYLMKNFCVTGVWLHSRQESTNFYERIGFTYIGASPEDCDLKEYRMFISVEKIMEIIACLGYVEEYKDILNG